MYEDSSESSDVKESGTSRRGRHGRHGTLKNVVGNAFGKSGKSYDRLAEMVREELAWKYEIPKDGKPRIYKLRKEKIVWNQDLKIAKYEVGAKTNKDVKEKVLMLVGATGAGKTTMINGIANYVYGVEWKDDFRLKLITERKTQTNEETSASSQTKQVSAYTLHWQKGSPIPYTLTIIDTPGFGDTEGLDVDRQMLTKVHAFFAACKPHGLDSLSGIGFVLPASVSRLTGAQKYIFDSVMEMFGKDMKEKFYVLISFTDGQRPKVLNTLKAANIPHDKSFQFNNSALFSGNEADEGFQYMFWIMGIQSYSTFLSDFQHSDPVPLKLTMEVLEDRHRLREIMEKLESEIPRGLNRLEEFRETYQSLQNSKDNLEKFKVTTTISESVALPDGVFAINCTRCSGRTCEHPSDVLDKDLKLSRCMRTRTTTSTPRCIRCNCAFQDHALQSWRYEEKVVTALRSEAEVRRQYAKEFKKHASKEQLMKKLAAEIRSCQMEVYSMITDAHQLMNILRDKALRPEPMTAVEYIDLLIQAERGEAKKGYAERIQHLEAAKRASELTEKILQGQHNPFPQLRDAIDDMGVDLMELTQQATESVDAADSLVETIRVYLKKINERLHDMSPLKEKMKQGRKKLMSLLRPSPKVEP
ncbi:unnamed protein product [Darwinula stevensoni]|uniref:Septin-type G domain-containing protein n=1 Tax=Darwinula stevensoni TaxID=69355 RepID=A0A7R9AHH7_9CRUS|nr:unnamed protein product [Darwinula stevensoni]CAG0904408.1 unnamed protein product [Darwinula stevensoni]